MKLDTENLFLYVHYNMSALSTWDPKPAVLQWLKRCQRRERDCPKGKQQKYFRGVFEEAANADETDEENEDNFVEVKGKRKDF